MKYHISSSLFVLFCIVLCACNSSSVEKDGIIQPAFDLIERQIGERAADIQLEEIAPENGKETFEVEAKNGTLTLRGRGSPGRTAPRQSRRWWSRGISAASARPRWCCR